jgi:hypothetical protein
MMRGIFSLLAGLLLSLGFSGCLWEFAPSAPSRSDNTWLFGVWEGDGLKEGTTYRVVVAPTESDRMQVVYSEKNKAGKVVKSGTAAAWISRVGQVSLLVVELSPGPGDPSYLLLGYQILSPLSIRVREVTLDPPEPPANPFRLRVAIRKAFREGTLFGGGQAIWQRKGEVYWPENPDPATDTFTPPRVPKAPSSEDSAELLRP